MIGSFDDMMRDFKHGVYDFTKDGKCIECGNCCSRYLALSQKEINTIRRYIEKHHIKQVKHGVLVTALPIYDACCPFLDDKREKHKCLIYEVRPEICRYFKCDCWQNIEMCSDLYKTERHTVDMTELFFGKEEKI